MTGILKARQGFYRELFILLVPIVVQNLIASAVGMADVVMLGRVDQTSISASSLAGQVMFLLNVLFFGLNSALTILASQYWGKRDMKVISKILGIGLLISLAATVALALIAFFYPYFVIGIWTNVPELKDAGAVNVLVSLAGDGAVLIDEHDIVHSLPAPKGSCINFVGAGDAMLAGFISEMTKGGDYASAFVTAIASGSASAFSEHFASADYIYQLKKLLLSESV